MTGNRIEPRILLHAKKKSGAGDFRTDNDGCFLVLANRKVLPIIRDGLFEKPQDWRRDRPFFIRICKPLYVIRLRTGDHESLRGSP